MPLAATRASTRPGTVRPSDGANVSRLITRSSLTGLIILFLFRTPGLSSPVAISVDFRDISSNNVYNKCKIYNAESGAAHAAGSGGGPIGEEEGGVMFANRTRVLLVLSQDVMDRARVYVGQATIMLK